MERLRTLLDGLRSYWTNLTDRERRMMTVLGGVAAALVVALPVYLLSASIGDLEEENGQITSTLRDMSRSRGQIAAMRAERAARDERYAHGAPGEGWLPAKVGEHGLSFSRVQHEPERQAGRFRIRTTRASFVGVSLRPAVLLLADLKNSRYPVAIERIHVDHNRSGDAYNIEIGVLTFEREGGRAPDAGVAAPTKAPASGGRRVAGPAAP